MKPTIRHVTHIRRRKPVTPADVQPGIPTVLYLCPASKWRDKLEEWFRQSRHTRTYRIVSASNISEARMVIMRYRPIHLLLFDQGFFPPDVGVEDLMGAIDALNLEIPGMSCDVANFQEGEDYMPNFGAATFELELGPQIKAYIENSLLMNESNEMKRDMSTLSKIVFAGNSDAITRYQEALEVAARTDFPVLLEGETGTGKSVGARWIHDFRRKHLKKLGNLEEVNMAAVPESLAESLLFGHEKGAFTGATERQVGHFEKAEGGTIFLDEIGDCPLDLQKKLLKVIEERTFTRIGGSKPRTFEAKIVCATNRSLHEMVEEGTFRKDLYFRISAQRIECPSIRDRKGDIPEIVRQMVPGIAQSAGVQVTYDDIPNGFIQFLTRSLLEGNLRDLNQALIRLLTSSPRAAGGKLNLQLWEKIPDLTESFRNRFRKDPITYTALLNSRWEPFDSSFKGLKLALDEIRDRLIRCAMDQCNQDTAKAAELLKIPRSTLYGHLNHLNQDEV